MAVDRLNCSRRNSSRRNGNRSTKLQLTKLSRRNSGIQTMCKSFGSQKLHLLQRRQFVNTSNLTCLWRQVTCVWFNNFITRQLSQVKTIGHQVVGSSNWSHEDIQLMYSRFFGGETASIKMLLKEHFGSIRARKMLSQTFQVLYFRCTYTHNIMLHGHAI